MNRGVCEKCCRFAGKYPDKPDVWMCAKKLMWYSSGVIPGHKYIERDILHPISVEMTTPPEWCERMLEQTILSPDEKPDIDKDADIRFDGNNEAKFHAENKLKGGYTFQIRWKTGR